MKAPVRLFANAAGLSMAARLLACAGASAALSGCVGNPFTDARIDPQSPVAAEVAAAQKVNRPLPKFANFPALPKDVRPKQQYGVQAAQLDQTAAALDAATAPGTWTLTATDSFSASAQKAVGPDLPPVDPAVTAAFANDLRKRATPPPPPKR